jgi:hypothetical protein
MTLGEATARFLDYAKQHDSPVDARPRSSVHDQALLLLRTYFDSDSGLSKITPASLRDFLSRWYVEKACASGRSDFDPPEEPNQVPGSQDLLNSLAEFFDWADQESGGDQASQLSPLLIELSRALPLAIEITNALTNALRVTGGAFSFPEFLTSFEEGGGSQYDIDVPGNVGAIDGYFRIVDVQGALVAAEELISEERVWPIVFPDEVAALLDAEYIVNLELVRDREGWRIAGCGCAYPPGTEI